MDNNADCYYTSNNLHDLSRELLIPSLVLLTFIVNYLPSYHCDYIDIVLTLSLELQGSPKLSPHIPCNLLSTM